MNEYDALADDNWSVRWAAVHALAALGGNKARGAIIAMSGDESIDVRCEVALALGDKFGGDEVRDTLIAMSGDESADVRYAVDFVRNLK